MGQKDGEKWTAAVDSQPTLPKPDRLLGNGRKLQGRQGHRQKLAAPDKHNAPCADFSTAFMRLIRPFPMRLLTGLGLAAMAATASGQAHVHGEAMLEIVIEPGRLSLRLDTPQHNLLGHERAPRNNAERGCRLIHADVEAPALLPKGSAKAAGLHADVLVTYQFDCKSTAGLQSLAVGGLFDAFPGLQRIRAQVAAGSGAHQTTVKRPARLLAWKTP